MTQSPAGISGPPPSHRDPTSPSDPPRPRGRVAALFTRYVRFAERRTGWLLAAIVLVALATLIPVSQLELHTDMAELLPDTHPAVMALRRIAGRQKSASNLVMLIESPDQAANRRFAEALRPELAKLVPTWFTEIQWEPDRELPEYASRWRWMYAEKSDLESAESLLDRIVARRSQPLLVDLEGDPEDELRSLREKLNQKLPTGPSKDTHYFEALDGTQHWLGIMMWRQLTGFATAGDHQTLQEVQKLVSRMNPASFHPQLKVAYTGGIAQAIDEQNGIREDLTMATLVCGSLVMLVIYMYFRRMSLLLVIATPAVFGVLLSLVLARFTIQYLNINTAFLISIILGNGINTPIVLLARYGEERHRDVPVIDALITALSSTMLATATAMLAASIAYGCLLVTSFRGFNQFGLIGGSGMILVWISTMIIVPPLVIWGERRRPGVLTPGRNLWRPLFNYVGALSARRPMVPTLIALALLAVAAKPLWHYAQDPLEWDMNKLNSDETPSGKLWPRMISLGMGDVGAGYIGNNGVLLVDKPEQADAVAKALLDKDRANPKEHVLKDVRSLNSTLPKDQDEKLEILGRLRKKIDKHRELMSEKEWSEVSAWRPPDYLRKLNVEDLPRIVREAFTETDGHRGRLIGIDADYDNYQDWNGHDLMRMSKALQVDALGQHWVAASAATVFAGILETIVYDGPKVTLAALIGVLTLIIVAFGLRGSIPVLTSLFIGVAWLFGIAGAIKLKLNFMNFVALPITLGIGAEYAANIWARLRAEGPGRIQAIIADTGSAVALCSMTTIIGYSSLLLARNKALRSFGKLADLGEITCLVAALVVLPAFMNFALGKRKGAAEPK